MILLQSSWSVPENRFIYLANETHNSGISVNLLPGEIMMLFFDFGRRWKTQRSASYSFVLVCAPLTTRPTNLLFLYLIDFQGFACFVGQDIARSWFWNHIAEIEMELYLGGWDLCLQRMSGAVVLTALGLYPGNICRSPTAEAMFKSVVDKAGLSDSFTIDSCGTGGGNPDWYIKGGWSYHEGDDSDPRMKAAGNPYCIYLSLRY